MGKKIKAKNLIKTQQEAMFIQACIRKAKEGYILNDFELDLAQMHLQSMTIDSPEKADKAVENGILEWKILEDSRKEYEESKKKDAAKDKEVAPKGDKSKPKGNVQEAPVVDVEATISSDSK